MLHNYIIFYNGVEIINFKENMKNFNFKSLELRYWQAIYVEILHDVLGERSGIEVKSPKEVIIATVVGVDKCPSYRT